MASSGSVCTVKLTCPRSGLQQQHFDVRERESGTNTGMGRQLSPLKTRSDGTPANDKRA